MPQPLPAPLPFRAVQPLWSGPLPASGPPGPPWPVDVTEVTGLWLPVQVSGGLYHPLRLLHIPASTGTGRAGPQGTSHTGASPCPGCPRPAGCSHRCHSDTWSACGHLLTCEPLVWVTDGTTKASGPALCRVGHHGRSWPRPGLADQPGRAVGSPRAKCDQWCWGPGGAAVALGLQGWKGMQSGSGRVCGEGKENRAGGGRRGNPASATHRPCDLGSPDLSPALLI